ncbi:MAG: type II toxin-antitoxin system HicB family antitoxin, partial [Gammaproteobacteria bacterium]|nr:type II toxin-antitoxin system HicB family antitoxin [Gammaproteobacteria bacterium]MCP4363010.1 type II toxin-antitoxin system HicB family antitoxin [Chloroflexota bacterium]
TSEREKHPWLKFAGIWADDSTWNDFLAEVEAYRRQMDEADLEA